jgi:hypothetical protein
MKGSRVLHVLGFVVASLLTLATAAQKIAPKYGAPLAMIVALLTDAKALVAMFASRVAVAALYVLFIGAALYQTGCAHAGAVAGACEPVVSEISAVLAAAGPADYEAKIAKYIDAGHALCKVQAAADQLIALLTGKSQAAALMTDAGTIPASALPHLQAWRAAHP